MSQTFVQGIVVLLLWLMRLSLQQEYAGYSKYKNSDQLVFLNFGYVRNGLFLKQKDLWRLNAIALVGSQETSSLVSSLTDQTQNKDRFEFISFRDIERFLLAKLESFSNTYDSDKHGVSHLGTICYGIYEDQDRPSINQLSIYQLITFVKQGMLLLNMLLCKENDLSVLFLTTQGHLKILSLVKVTKQEV